MTQTTASVPITVSHQAQRGQRIRTAVLWVSGTLILLFFATWLVTALINDPVRFANSAMAGLQNGALYALIALGYTLVYGIIELINFAHGDLFMLGTLFAGLMITTVFGIHAPGSSWLGWLMLVVSLVTCALFCGAINVSI